MRSVFGTVCLFCTFMALVFAMGISGAFASQKTQVQSDEAEVYLDYSVFAELPVLHAGRIKPLGSYARIRMREIAGDETPFGKSATYWLVKILFNPAAIQDEKLFTLRSDEIKHQFGVAGKKDKRFSLAELRGGLKSSQEEMRKLLELNEKKLTPQQREFLNIHESASALAGLMRAMTVILPMDITLPKVYEARFEGRVLNYLNISAIETPVVERLREIIGLKGKDPESYTDEERKIALLAFQLQSLRGDSGTVEHFKILPENWGRKDGGVKDWFSPWALLLTGNGGPDNAVYLKHWTDMALAYRIGDAQKWQNAVMQAKDHIDRRNLYSQTRFKVENFYHLTAPFEMAGIFYGLSILGVMIYIARSIPVAYRFAALGTLAAIAFHIMGIAARVYILDRPPVGTLYESLLFVALVCALVGFMSLRKGRRAYALLSGNICALGLLMLAPVILPGADSLEVLVAVLNTNFWLTTHVLIITAGYGFCMIAAALAHFYLFQRMRAGKHEKRVLALHQLSYKVSIIALLFTAVGTVLGGIWADQSWGRFWGWDPKENGALLIVLWLIWLQHGRLSGHLRDVPFMAGVAFLNVIVALAWFGVNLLSVGLHSYGFTSGIALGLGVFCGVEIAIIAAFWVIIRIIERAEKNRNLKQQEPENHAA